MNRALTGPERNMAMTEYLMSVDDEPECVLLSEHLEARTCDTCGERLIPFAGTWMCPDTVAKLGGRRES